MKKEERILENELSLQRPAWTQHDLLAFNHRIHTVKGQKVIDENYFVKTRGFIK